MHRSQLRSSHASIRPPSSPKMLKRTNSASLPAAFAASRSSSLSASTDSFPAGPTSFDRFFFHEGRHESSSHSLLFECEGTSDLPSSPVDEEESMTEWRIKSRMKTGFGVLVMALNIGIDPPNEIKTDPCARVECWIDPMARPAAESLPRIGKALQSQYERWQPRARYKQCLDPTVDEIKKVCKSMRRNAKRERILFHYNGRGVPFPTTNSEIWVFNKNYTQYIPMSLIDLNSWLGSPAIYVFDCSKAEIILQWYALFASKQREESDEPDNKRRSLSDQPADRSVIVLAACQETEYLPTNPELPADIFTACLTTPIKMALRWFITRTALSGVTAEMVDSLPGNVNDRRTPLGELNWIFTAITDTIAWNVLPPHLFQQLFRQDLLVASLMRNFLLAERIMRSCGCTPVSMPKLPPTFQHPLWRAWDLAVDICISRLPSLLRNPKDFLPNPFFNDQLTAFEVWLEFASQKNRKPPEQLPIVLQVLLSKQHRYKALQLLAQFLDLGAWAVNYALSVGIFPYVLKLLQSPLDELRPILVSIWARILALDLSCQSDLLKDSGHIYFAKILTSPSTIPSQRAACAFVLCAMMDGHPSGQAVCLSHGVMAKSLQALQDDHADVRWWSILCLAKLWHQYAEAKRVALRDGVHERLCQFLTDRSPEVRTASVFALGCLFGAAGEDEEGRQIERNIALTLFIVTADSSPMARRELLIALSRLIFDRPQVFLDAVMDISREELKSLSENERGRGRRMGMLGQARSKVPAASMYGNIWKIILSLRRDPFPPVASLAQKLAAAIFAKVCADLDNEDPEASLLCSHLVRRCTGTTRQSTTPSTPRRRDKLLNTLRTQRDGLRQSFSGLPTAVEMEETGAPASVLSALPDFSTVAFPSRFYSWSFRTWSQPYRGPTHDQTSQETMEREWRTRRQKEFYEQIHGDRESILERRFDSQLALMNDTAAEVISILRLHPTEPLCVSADDRSHVNIWNWEDSTKLQRFSNLNPPKTHVSSLEMANTSDQLALLVGTNDGIVRVWTDLYETTPRLVTAWRALTTEGAHGGATPQRGSGLVMSWNQKSGQLMTAGDAPLLRVWDVERELCIQDVPTSSEGCSITTVVCNRHFFFFPFYLPFSFSLDSSSRLINPVAPAIRLLWLGAVMVP